MQSLLLNLISLSDSCKISEFLWMVKGFKYNAHIGHEFVGINVRLFTILALFNIYVSGRGVNNDT